jgi:hypothetical protein
MSKNRSKNRNQLGQLVSRIDPTQLNTLYQNSIRMNPTLHHPAIVAGTASPDHVRRDFESWFAGVQAGIIAAQQLQQQGQQWQQQGQAGQQPVSLFQTGSPLFEGVTTMTQRPSYPPNVQQSLQLAVRTLSGANRIAA